MNGQMLVRRRGFVIGIAVLIVMVALGFGHSQAGLSSAQDGQAEMTLQIGDCEDECDVSPGVAFGLGIAGTTLPAGGYGGFQVELFLDGIRHRMRSCEEEVKMEPVALCLGPDVFLGGQVIYGGMTGLPPFPLPGSTSSPVVLLSAICDDEGTHEVVLTAFPSSQFGAMYKDVNGETVEVRTVGTRELVTVYDKDPVEVEVADTLTVNCRVPAPPTEPPEEEATPTATPVLPPTGNAGSIDGAGGSNAGLWAVIAALAAAAVAGLAVVGWWVRGYARGRQVT